jgi:serine/threonine-protein kinase RsbW
VDTRQICLSFPGTMAGLEQAAASLSAALQGNDLDPRARYHVELVFEEIVANIVRYAAPGGAAAAVDVSLEVGARAIVMTFEDDGLPFDPCSRPDPTLPRTLEEAPVGGLGLLLVRRMATALRYERTPTHMNRLTVTLASAPGQEARTGMRGNSRTPRRRG